MKLLNKLLRGAQRRYLDARIRYEHPDWSKTMDFKYVLQFFIEESVEAHIKNEVEGDLPLLVRQAIDYTSTKSAGYYHAQLLLSQLQCQQAEERSVDWLLEHQERKRERDEYKEVAQLATDAAQQALDYINTPIKPNISLN